MSILHLLNRSATWQRDQPTGVKGRFVLNPVTIQADLPVRVQIAGATDKTIGFQERAEVTHVFFTEPAVQLLYGDLLFVDGVRYKVISKQPPSKPEHHLRWLMQEQQESSGTF